MPELPEVEGYRSLAERTALGREIRRVDAPDAWYLKRGLVAEIASSALTGRTLVAARRRGKLLLLDIGGGPDAREAGGVDRAGQEAGSVDRAGREAGSVDRAGREAGSVLGLHFGMSGRLIVDGRASVDRLLYAPAGDETRHDRFTLNFADGGWLAMRDARRLGAVEIDPDEDRLGPDALTATLADIRAAVTGSSTAVKARLLDQSRLAGVGNLLADEMLWRAGLAPARPCRSLSTAEVRRLHRHLTGTLVELIRRGGSHTGDLQPERHPGGHCPRDGAELARGVVGGRTTWWCPKHQR
jgi:formamidopyrimidine-DNA glycosylase